MFIDASSLNVDSLKVNNKRIHGDQFKNYVKYPFGLLVHQIITLYDTKDVNDFRH